MKLQRKLGFWDVFCIAAGAMISSGLFVLPAIAYRQAGPAAVLSYAVAAVLVIPAMFAKAELATAMPRSGGSYFFIERSMGALPGTMAGLANWLSIAMKTAFALVGIGAFGELLWGGQPEWVVKAIAIGFCLLFTTTNLLSVKTTGRLQVIMVAALLGVLGVFVIGGIPAVRHDAFKGFMRHGWGNMLATSGLVFVSFGGLTKVASIAGEVRHPGRNIPRGMFAAIAVVSLLYVAAVFVVAGVCDASELERTRLPLSLAARAFLGPTGAVLLALGGMLAFVTTGNSGILSASRSPMAMSRDGLLPAALGRIGRRFGTPHVSILLTAAFMIAIIAALSIEDLVRAASTMMLMLFALVNLAVLIMRSSGIQNYRPLFRAPGYPWLQVLGILVYVFLITEMGAAALWSTAAFASLAALWYMLYVRPRIRRESAFVYMVKNIVSKEIRRSGLEEELKEIALERDEIVRDRFDKLISNCVILDLPGAVSVDEMFAAVAEAISPQLDMPPDALLEKFRRREAQSSTVIQPGLAIPHVVIEGKGLFNVAMVRCRKGVKFPGHREPVHAVFTLIGTPDERNYHLRALMAIAHIVQEHDFTRRWFEAPEAEHLRDIVLLSGRQRHHDQPDG